MVKRTKKVAVVTPVYRARLTADEEVSFGHLQRHLSSYDRYLVAPRSLDVRWPGFGVRRFGDAYFKSPQTYSALMLSRGFYRAFRDYEYILIYQLDALVFSDQLAAWCDKGFDYIGAPWFNSVYTPHITTPHVGNGGFSLRRVQGFLDVLDSRALARTYWVDPDAYWAAFRAGKSKVRALANVPRKYLMRLHAFNSPKRMLAQALKYPAQHIEDEWWSREAVKYLPAFRVAPVEEGVRFAFEREPRLCLEMTGGALPFGCHFWNHEDRDFWEPYLGPPARPM